MKFTGQIKNGAVVLDNAQVLPEGARVAVLLKLSGIIEGLPDDFVENHDHYMKCYK